MVGIVSIAAVESEKVVEAERQIRLILNPPTAEVGAVYPGRVVNITKFGAFVNILPGRDGLVHISKLGGGKRIDSVESVLSLGDELEVKVDDVDPNGKISLSPVGDSSPKASDGAGSDADVASSSSANFSNGATETTPAPAPRVDDDLVVVNFGDAYDATAAERHGDLGPAVAGNFGGGSGAGGGGRDRGGRDRGGRDRRPRRR
jgi:polyribonucleotide nucleotidyltransferase